jgi:hypothetical protein
VGKRKLDLLKAEFNKNPYGNSDNGVLFSFQINFGNRTGGKTENPMNCAPYSNSAHFINAKEFWRLHLVG